MAVVKYGQLLKPGGFRPGSNMPSTFLGGNTYPGRPHGNPGGGGNGGGGKGGGNGGGGNGGGGKGGKGGKGGGKKGGGKGIQGFSLQDLFSLGMNLAHPVRQTKNEMKLIYGPQISGLKNDYSNYANQMGALYTVLGNQIGDVGKNAGQNYSNVNQDYTQGTQDILGSLAQSTAPDQAAFLKTLGSQAIAGSKDLAQSATNEARYNASMGDQAGLENTILQRNASGDLNTALEQLRKQRATDFKTTLDQNQQSAFERMLALKQMQLNAAQVAQAGKGDKWTRQFLQDMVGNALNPGGGGGGGHGGPGGGGTGPKNGPGGNTNGPVGDQTQTLHLRNAIHSLLSGQKTFQDLSGNRRQALKQNQKKLLNPFASAIASTYQNVVGQPNPQDSLLQLLRHLARAQAGGGGGGPDHFPGPGR